MEVQIKNIDISKIANSGQCFRMYKTNLVKGGYLVISADKVCIAKQVDSNVLLSIETKDKAYWNNYFDIHTDYNIYFKQISKTKDSFIFESYKFSKGLIILNQDIFETIISFVISQRNNIPRIKTIVEKMCLKFGHRIKYDCYSFPSLEELSKADINQLSEIGLGYRAKYIYEICQFFLNNDIDEYFESHVYDQLLTLNGIGPKVANCVCLYAFHILDAFPIDTWIEQIIINIYDGEFDTDPYDGYQGLIQLYMFYYYRFLNEKKRKW